MAMPIRGCPVLEGEVARRFIEEAESYEDADSVKPPHSLF